jgi:hypothetical protein
VSKKTKISKITMKKARLKTQILTRKRRLLHKKKTKRKLKTRLRLRNRVKKLRKLDTV